MSRLRENATFATFAVDLLELGERAVLVRRVVSGKEAIVLISEEVTLEPREPEWVGQFQMTMPMSAAKECGLVE